ncbi:hypothetical protein KIH31_14545 [Paenarthrobacter sp. DKR-5]|uniref:hypothetical protein n=1 Tax=Paenarthrobacter sp. DKR-5 TaxID=2835535 RepID=UPI001BDD75DF|nr:hypothetical protein [Paenarthrobacter sp. DKR-5]MBT1003820.1 hypothetical protein [Paenarthrobacter sp. DKR-5]
MRPGDEGFRQERFDRRALRFAIGFPFVLAAVFDLLTWLLRSRLPDPLALHWGSAGADVFAPLPVLLAVAGCCIVAGGAVLMIQGARRRDSAVLSRMLMGAGTAVALLLAAVFASLVVGQLDVPDARAGSMDSIVFAMGAGAALGLGATMGFVYQPPPRWTEQDEEAVRRVLAPQQEESGLVYWLHPRSTVYTLLVMMAVSVGTLTALAAWWLGVLVVLLVLLAAAFLAARVAAGPGGLQVAVAGLVRVLNVPASELAGAEEREVTARDYGGWGYRVTAAGSSYLVGSGPVVVVHRRGGPDVVVGTRSAERAAELAAVLRAAGSAGR